MKSYRVIATHEERFWLLAVPELDVVTRPNVAGRWNELIAVAAVSEDVAFAVGHSEDDVKNHTLGMHCC